MRTATICGSMKFEKEMMSVLFMLETKHHFNILQCIYSPERQELSEKELTALAQAHYKKIELSDAIYVLDINGYIGEQVTKEIAYAKSLGKEIIYHSSFMGV